LFYIETKESLVKEGVKSALYSPIFWLQKSNVLL